MFFQQKNKKKEAGVIDVQVGSKCGVITQDNRILFVGIVQYYNSEQKELVVRLQMGTCSHDNIPYNTILKIQIFSSQQNDMFVLLYARIKRYGMDEWVLQLDEVMSRPNQRENFRLRVSNSGVISHEDSVQQHSCRLVDISLTGVLVSCGVRFELRQEFILNLEQLIPGGSPYTLRCRVRRIVETVPYAYGCEFVDLTPKQERQLYHDIFALQSKALRTIHRVEENS